VAGVGPLIEAVVRDVADGAQPAIIARRFHSTVVELIGAVCERLAARTGLDSVALSGGVFMNAILTRETVRRLERAGLRAYRHQLVPPNDGGLCLGQLAVAAQEP
jgi:hydrogenase maturation protein HypF